MPILISILFVIIYWYIIAYKSIIDNHILWFITLIYLIAINICVCGSSLCDIDVQTFLKELR